MNIYNEYALLSMRKHRPDRKSPKSESVDDTSVCSEKQASSERIVNFDSFKKIDPFEMQNLTGNKSELNTYKRMIMEKNVTRSSLTNFLMMVYFLYYRMTLEIGTCDLNRVETGIVNIILFLIMYSLINQGSRFMFMFLKKVVSLSIDFFWIYQNLDEIKHRMNRA